MLHGNRDEVIDKVRVALQTAAFSAWDVVRPSPTNNHAQATLIELVEEAIRRTEINVEPSDLPLHGCMNIDKLAAIIIPNLCEAYGKPVLTHKQRMLTYGFKAKLELLFNSVPRTKIQLKQRHPELFPSIRRRKA